MEIAFKCNFRKDMLAHGKIEVYESNKLVCCFTTNNDLLMLTVYAMDRFVALQIIFLITFLATN